MLFNQFNKVVLRTLFLSASTKNKLITGFMLLAILFSGQSISTTLNIVTEHLAPFQIVKGDNISGLSTEIIKATLTEANITYSLAAHPWSLSYNSALQKKNTCIYSLARIPTRSALFQWIGHITTSSTSLYALNSNPLAISKLAQAKNYKIAVIKDDVAHHFLLSKGFIENKNLYVMDNNDALLKILEIPSRQIDLVVINDDLLNRRLDKVSDMAKYKNVYMFKELLLDFYFACSLNTEKTIVTSLKQAMNKLEQLGAFSDIKKKWQGNMINIL
tara:strand:+ start:16788 stop:17609 length:822 start_codon:yes stop_codon:yes gene_type:complete